MSRANHLVAATSPYLLQHAHNPVDWYPWGPEALGLARDHDRLILLSIGYAACHWCHVMERESFENETIAAIMNRHFVNIKVDREERPDLDDLYMAATVAMNEGQGGWPMTVFLTPSLEPIFAGTYFPPEDRWGRPGFATVLRHVAEAWELRRDELRVHGRQVVAHLARGWEPGERRGDLERLIPSAVQQLLHQLDRHFRGFGGAPKFPPHSAVSLLQLEAARGNRDAADAAGLTLDGILRGGIRDHIGGGFARYAVDGKWLVPHFEKMLSDNALLLRALARSIALGGPRTHHRAAHECVAFLLRELRLPTGAYATSLDADSAPVAGGHPEEGLFSTWTPEEVEAALADPALAALAIRAWDITTEGHLDGRAVPNLISTDLEALAQERGETITQLEAHLDEAARRLHRVREARPRPALDDKVLVSWNGLLISALAEAGLILDRPDWIDAAQAAAEAVLRHQCSDRVLWRSWRQGRRGDVPGFLDDYASFADGLIDLAEAAGQGRFLDLALELAEELLARFQDPDSGALFTVASDGEALPARTRDAHDGALPATGAIAAKVLVRLSEHFDRPDLREAARRAIEVDGEAAAGYPRAFCTLLEVADRLASGAVEVVIVGAADDPGTAVLLRVVATTPLPHRTLERGEPSVASERPLLRDRTPTDPAVATAWVCRRGVCSLPLTDSEALRAALLATR
jgi:uncharacterized protein YyaL (SSP411 family)